MRAKNKNINLSKLNESRRVQEISPLVNSLSAIVKLPKNFEDKKEYREHLVSKYGK